jgi:hypothetical protein
MEIKMETQIAIAVKKLEKLFDLKVCPKKEILVSREDFLKTDKSPIKPIQINDLEFSVKSPTGIELLVIRLHNGKIGSMRCGDQIMNLSIN